MFVFGLIVDSNLAFALEIRLRLKKFPCVFLFVMVGGRYNNY